MTPSFEKAVLLTGFGRPVTPYRSDEYLMGIYGDTCASPLPGWLETIPFMRRFAARLEEKRTRLRYLSVEGKSTSRDYMNNLVSKFSKYLEEIGEKRFRVFQAVRFGSPSISEALAKIAGEGIDEVVVIPISPFYSRSFTGSIEEEVKSVCHRPPCYDLKCDIIKSWYESSELVKAWVDSIKSALTAFPAEVRDDVYFLFVARSIPMKNLEKYGDVYPSQVLESSRLIADLLGRQKRMSISYLCGEGYGKWLGPFVDEELLRLGAAGVKNCLIVPIGFLHDGVETWCDLDMDLVHRVGEFGMTQLERAYPPNVSKHVLEALANLI